MACNNLPSRIIGSLLERLDDIVEVISIRELSFVLIIYISLSSIVSFISFLEKLRVFLALNDVLVNECMNEEWRGCVVCRWPSMSPSYLGKEDSDRGWMEWHSRP